MRVHVFETHFSSGDVFGRMLVAGIDDRDSVELNEDVRSLGDYPEIGPFPGTNSFTGVVDFVFVRNALNRLEGILSIFLAGDSAPACPT